MRINEALTRQLREQAGRLLESGEVACVIGYELGPRGRVRPAFVYDVAEVDRLVWGTECVHNLTTYLHDKKKPQKRGEKPPRIAVVVRPCDSRAINVLLAERQIEREQVYVIGVGCEGVEETDQPATRCGRCPDRVPVVYDVLLGEAQQTSPIEDDFADLSRLEEMPPEERLAFWLRQFDRCIRCYACRQVCFGCYCHTCMFERDDGLWVDIGIELSQKHMFHLGRALHLAGRCIECDECERVCPMELPLSLLNRQLVREVMALFGHRAGREVAPTPLLFELGEEGSPI
jgi:formate dehydrogenase subunit beta